MSETVKIMSVEEFRARIQFALRKFAEDTEPIWKRLDEQAELNDQIGWATEEIVDIFRDYLNSRMWIILEKL